jgi:hypothetical protein
MQFDRGQYSMGLRSLISVLDRVTGNWMLDGVLKL